LENWVLSTQYAGCRRAAIVAEYNLKLPEKDICRQTKRRANQDFCGLNRLTMIARIRPT
jgi:hypothetical protein